MDAVIQQTLDDITELTSVSQSIAQGIALLEDQATSQAAIIDGLRAQAASGAPISLDDLATLKAANGDFTVALQALKTAIPANTPASADAGTTAGAADQNGGANASSGSTDQAAASGAADQTAGATAGS